MAFDLFRTLSIDELEGCIRSLSLQIASGATNISSPDAGSAGYITPGAAMKLVKAMERSRARRLGLPVDPSDQIRVTKIVPGNDYYQR